jgi:hypothetical protein
MHREYWLILKHDSVNVHNNEHLDTSGRPFVLRVAESRRGCQLVADGAEARGNPPSPFGVARVANISLPKDIRDISITVQVVVVFMALHYYGIRQERDFIAQCCSMPPGTCEELFPRLTLCCIPSLRSSAPAWWLCSPG